MVYVFPDTFSNSQEYFENLNPLEDRDEKSFNDYLYEKSLEIEPRGARQLNKFVSYLTNCAIL